jgi:hypothetical protein
MDIEVRWHGILGRAIDQTVSRRLPTAATAFGPGSDHVAFAVDKVALARQVLSNFFRLSCQFSFHQLLHIHLSSYYRCDVESKWKNYHIITFPGQSLSKTLEEAMDLSQDRLILELSMLYSLDTGSIVK